MSISRTAEVGGARDEPLNRLRAYDLIRHKTGPITGSWTFDN